MNEPRNDTNFNISADLENVDDGIQMTDNQKYDPKRKRESRTKETSGRATGIPSNFSKVPPENKSRKETNIPQNQYQAKVTNEDLDVGFQGRLLE